MKKINLLNNTKNQEVKVMEEVKGRVERVNPKGIKIEGRWYNYSKYMEEEVPVLNEGDEVKAGIKGEWVMKLNLLSRQNFEEGNLPFRQTQDSAQGWDKRGNYYLEKERREAERQVVITRLACLNTATEILKSLVKPITSKNVFKIAEELESWVWRSSREENGENGEDPEKGVVEKTLELRNGKDN